MDGGEGASQTCCARLKVSVHFSLLSSKNLSLRDATVFILLCKVALSTVGLCLLLTTVASFGTCAGSARQTCGMNQLTEDKVVSMMVVCE